MATTDLTSILAAWREVLEATPLSLGRAAQPFTFDRIPNAALQNAYYIEPAGQVGRRSQTNDVETRVDRLIVWVAKPLAFAANDQLAAMVTLMDEIYRYLSADGRTNGWNVEQDGHQVQQPKKTELLIGRFSFTVDYDFDAST